MELAAFVVLVFGLVGFGLVGVGVMLFLIALGAADILHALEPRLQVPPGVSTDEHVRSGKLVDTFLQQLSQQYENRITQALSATPERRSSDDEEE